MNLIDVTKELATDEQCLLFLEKRRWPNGIIRCTTCGCDRVSKIERKAGFVSRGKTMGKDRKNRRSRVYQCLEKTCKQQFSATNGTIFHDSHLPLSIWFMAVALVMDAKKGISAKQLQQHLGIGSYKTAWHVCHRIRKAMENKESANLSGVIEMDETYLPKTSRGAGKNWRKRRSELKQVIVGIKERGGRVKLIHAPDAKIETLAKYLKEHVSADVEAIMTDELPAYPKALRLSGHDASKHFTVNHSAKIYVDGDTTTNGIESAFSLFKRGVVGSYHRISIKHLHRYLSEFETRFNQRKSEDRFNPTVVAMLRSQPMPYRELVDGDKHEQF